MARRSPPRKVTYFEPVLPRLARNTIIESTFEVGRPHGVCRSAGQSISGNETIITTAHAYAPCRGEKPDRSQFTVMLNFT